MNRHLWTFVLAACVALFGSVSVASAYCRQSVKTPPLGQCMEMEGVQLLYWDRSCVTMVFNRNFFDLFPDLSEEQIRSDFEAGFATWREVQCSSGEDPFQVVFNSGVTDTNVAEFQYDVENESLISARSYEQWAQAGRNPDALALTLLWHNPETGEVLDVDMEFHAGAGNFGTCDEPCDDATIDLLNAVTHEAGHVLGLGHTTYPDATMWRDSDDGENKKRSLDQDDREGLCALNMSGKECADRESCTCGPPPKYSKTTTVGGCGCGITGAGRLDASAGLVALGALSVICVRARGRARRRNAT